MVDGVDGVANNGVLTDSSVKVSTRHVLQERALNTWGIARVDHRSVRICRIQVCACTKGLETKDDWQGKELTPNLACLSVHLSHSVLRRLRSCLVRLSVSIAERWVNPDERSYPKNMLSSS